MDFQGFKMKKFSLPEDDNKLLTPIKSRNLRG